ncbi:MAG: hypothetical protein ABW328_12735 [Ilumatobacteraceae bacterium]
MLDWDPNDPETVKVHYDVTVWSLDQRAELIEALADADIAHVWEEEELVVPEALEADVDELFERLEALLGPFPVPLPDDDPGIEYALEEWSAADRAVLSAGLVESEVPHRWEEHAVVVATDAEESVDALLDAVEQGTYVPATGEAAIAAPEGALDTMFSSADRLARDPDDTAGRDALRDLVPQLQANVPPYGVSTATWAKAVDAAIDVGILIDDDDASASDIIGAAQVLRSLVRQFVS